MTTHFVGALGDHASAYETEIRQLVTLMRNKLQQIRSYYQASMEKHASEQQRDLLGRRAARASALVQTEQVPRTACCVRLCFGSHLQILTWPRA